MKVQTRLALLALLAGCTPSIVQPTVAPNHEGAGAGSSTTVIQSEVHAASCTHEMLSAGLESTDAHIVGSATFPTRSGEVVGFVVAREADADRFALEVQLRACADGVARAFGGLRFGSTSVDALAAVQVDAVDFYGEGLQALQVHWADHGEDADGPFERVDFRWFGVRAGEATMLGSCIETWVSGGDGHRGLWNLLTPGEPPRLEGVREVDGAEERFGGELMPVLEGAGRDDLCSRGDAAIVERVR